ncbi:hypothetical protein [Propionibacterium freudenreichii]|uniref:hypothetical protein n=1 Tax=Propionibacterium freudenreichii TaxID=1744 RepID=UPI0025510007|nr:hypothetical protein [Propionibacterium freudenreichii]MDK9661729.1 hypothetical protein [Propionibacterium freudenreichii]
MALPEVVLATAPEASGAESADVADGFVLAVLPPLADASVGVAEALVSEVVEVLAPGVAVALVEVGAVLVDASEVVSADALDGQRARDNPTAGMAARMKPAVRV